MRSRSRSIGLVLAILAAFTVAAPVAAANQWVTFKQSGTTAFAFTDSCSDNPDGTVTCSGESIEVFDGTIKEPDQPTFSGERVCYSEHTFTYDPTSGETIESSGRFGCAPDADTVRIRKLNSITLAPTVIELTESVCGPTECTESPGGSVTVDGTWTGVGPTMSQSGKFRFDDGTCIQVHADESKFRVATFVGAFDALEARISKGSSTFKTTCPF
jgi:hypothetical protein